VDLLVAFSKSIGHGILKARNEPSGELFYRH
jgi:hypothetical protein